jgi:glycosyltransferase involved in cell wall biosynthesis
MSLRIIWSSNALWAPTGYGVQAKSILPRLQKLGHEVAQFAWYGLQGGTMEADGIRIYPAAYDHWGVDVIGSHVKHFNADLVISLQDIWVLPDDYVQRCRPARWACWFPVDQQPMPGQVVKLAQTADYPITYSEFGQREALAAGIENSRYIPHGIETSIFRPGDKLEARQKMKLPADAFLCAMVAANKGTPSRKAFAENLLAFGAFRRAHNNALLYLHTLESQATGGVDFGELIPACGIPSEAVRFVDQYHYTLGLPPEYLATVYQASDMLLAASQSEGFGIPLIEAQACGCPVITTDCTSMTELTINGIATQPVQRFWTPLNSWAFVPSPAAIEDALWKIWGRTPAEAAAEAQRGVTHVHRNYDWDVLVRDWWAPFLAQVEQDVRQECPQPVTWPVTEVVDV